MLPKTRLGKRSPLGALVYFQFGGAGERPGVVDQPDLLQSDVSTWPSSLPSSSSSSSVPLTGSRSVSSCIDVPRSQRSPEEVDMDEMMAAMVLSSLSCSPLLHSPVTTDPTAPLMDSGSGGSGDLSDSCSSGYWSVGHANGSPAPSPPRAEHDISPATPPDEGLDMELEQVLFDEPAPRKRRNSLKVAYRCLWPTCGKVLMSVVGIKRHIRTTHLCRGGEHERCSRSEEDFYYTEIIQRDHQQQQPLLCGPAPSSPTTPSTSSSPSSPPSPPPPSPPSPSSPACGVLSRSAPSSSSGSFQQVQSEHSYQGLSFRARGSVAKPRSVVKFTALNTETSGARPAAGRKPANASLTEVEEEEEDEQRWTVTEELNFTGQMFYTFLRLKTKIIIFLFLYSLYSFSRSVFFSLNVYLVSVSSHTTCVLLVLFDDDMAFNQVTCCPPQVILTKPASVSG
ncbi:hypothetical protein INR49_028706 [Caranx melampygus]|nr:hypothetical protein INR49_028706 [Caranx melampygus]